MSACSINLFDKLAGSPTSGGIWTQLTGPQSVTITGGYLGTVDFCPAVDGVYTFKYSFNPTDTPAVVTVTVGNPPSAGTNATITATESNGAINLYSQLGGSPTSGGTWTVSPALPAGTLTGNNYDPAVGDGLLAGKVYVFTYTVTTPGSDPGCGCCTKTSTVTVTVYLGGNVGSDASVTVCADN